MLAQEARSGKKQEEEQHTFRLSDHVGRVDRDDGRGPLLERREPVRGRNVANIGRVDAHELHGSAADRCRDANDAQKPLAGVVDKVPDEAPVDQPAWVVPHETQELERVPGYGLAAVHKPAHRVGLVEAALIEPAADAEETWLFDVEDG